MKQSLLVINAGSSSIKFTVYLTEHAAQQVDCEGQIDNLEGSPALRISDPQGNTLHHVSWSAPRDHESVLQPLLHWLETRLSHGYPLAGAAHRVVHGGTFYARPTLIDETVLDRLRRLIPLAPLHQPHHIAAIEALSRLHPRLPQVACFDTAFHQDQTSVATTFALPRALTQKGIRRYGFHGLSYEYVVQALPVLMGKTAAHGRVIVAHLGSGASLCAIHQGRSVATTMGLTALDGLPMSHRCGAIDPGVVLYLLQHEGLSADAVSDLLYNQSGLKGVSGISGDMQDLLASPSPEAREAIDLFVYRTQRELGSLAAALGGLDTLVFTAGIGENAALIRERIGQAAYWLGIRLDEQANRQTARGARCISTPRSPVAVWIVPTDENHMIAQHAVTVLGLNRNGGASGKIVT